MDEPSESRNQHSRLLPPQAAHDDGSVFPRTGGPGGGNTENPAMLWGEHGLGRTGIERCGEHGSGGAPGTGSALAEKASGRMRLPCERTVLPGPTRWKRRTLRASLKACAENNQTWAWLHLN
ncbi:hypothetical protein NDU88_002769 [Pleurodeles waltl]|uniref:Uncharacterized protein n=1 Tax=Pleurodeles waltl TaxID=8319 RepID=A0AAV7LGM4_PLEWA|nr:hypothetical protein NDU88_002769 [Pleurodeles waltl]